VQLRLDGATGTAGGAQASTPEATLDYLPGRSRRRGAFVLPAAPPADGLTSRVVGWAAP
jgi:uncharacterized protein (TIGR02588 family)